MIALPSYEMKDLPLNSEELPIHSGSRSLKFEESCPLTTQQNKTLELQAPTSGDKNGSRERIKNLSEEEALPTVGSLYPDATLWGVSYASISSTGAPPPDVPKGARKETRRKSSFRRAAEATARLLGLSRNRSSYKLDRIKKVGNDRRASYP